MEAGSEITLSLGELIRLHRTRAGFKIRDLADELGVGISTLVDLEKDRIPTIEEIEAAIERLKTRKEQEQAVAA